VHTFLHRIRSAMSPLALAVSLVALVAGSAGVGYAVGQIGTSDIKNNAITAAKIKKNAVTTKKIKKNAVTTKQIKDGSLSGADLVAEEKYRTATLANGTEGDCIWQSADSELPGLGLPSFRKDRNGVVHLSGVALVTDGPGGDGDCNPGAVGQGSDGIAFTLPAGYVPFKTMIFAVGGSPGMVIAGPNGLTTPSFSFPPGTVATLSSSAPVILDGITFDAAGSPTVARQAAGQRPGAASGDLGDVLHQLGLR
jgi:hypothetical protein